MALTTATILAFALLAPYSSNGFSTTHPLSIFGVSSPQEVEQERIRLSPLARKSTSLQPSTSLQNVIRGLEEQDLIDEGLGGVTLAIESAVLVLGKYDRKSDEFSLSDIARYSELSEVKNDSMLQKYQSKVIGAGEGVECYYSPGEGTAKKVDFAPVVAAKNAVDSISMPPDEITTLSINILGGDELIINEAVDGALQVVRSLQLPSKCSIVMTSLCHSTVPATSASVTLVAESGNGQGEDGIEKGYMYQFDSKLWTLNEDRLRTEVS